MQVIPMHILAAISMLLLLLLFIVEWDFCLFGFGLVA